MGIEMNSMENQDHSDERKLKLGYRLSIFGGDDVPHELPEYLTDDETLEPALEQISTFIKAWVKAGAAHSEAERWRSFSLGLVGPMEPFTRDRRSPEQKLSEAETVEDQADAYLELATARFDSGEFEESRVFLDRLMELPEEIEGDYDPLYYRSRARMLEGRLSLKEGDLATAKRYLIEAATGDGSAVMSFFGPNMSLAHDLLGLGECDTVLDYFAACRKFWTEGQDELDIWEMYVRAGRVPDFGVHLKF